MNCFVFDVDGTLIDSIESSTEALRLAVEGLTPQPVTDRQLRRAFGMPSKEQLEVLGVADPDGTVEQRLSDIISEFGKHPAKLFPGVLETLQELRRRGIPLGVVTSKNDQEFADSFLPLGIEPYFTQCVNASFTKRHKPFPDPLDKFFELTGLCKETAVYVGDTCYDASCAHAAGVRFALAGWGCAFPDGIEADFYLDKPGDLLKLL